MIEWADIITILPLGIKKKQHTVGTVPKSNIKTGCYLNESKP
jgi:hypothetical protein